MFSQIFSLLLDLVAGILTGGFLLRLYMQYLRIPLSARFGNPLGRFVLALTDWLVLPLRRLFPFVGGLDTACLVAIYALQCSMFGLLWLLAGVGGSFASVLVLAAFGVIHTAVTGMTGIVIIYAVLSWVPGRTVMTDLMDRLVTPPLTPIRRVLPLLGGMDLSPLVLLVLLQIIAIVLAHLQPTVLMAL